MTSPYRFDLSTLKGQITTSTLTLYVKLVKSVRTSKQRCLNTVHVEAGLTAKCIAHVSRYTLAMSEAWLNFAIVICIQFLLFIIHALYEKRLSDALRILGLGVVGGVVLGLFFDLILGKSFNFFSYTLGFDPFFVVLNALLFYGLFVANVLLMQKVRLVHFLVWILIVGAVTEATNLYFHLWTWKYASLPLVEYLAFLLLGYFGIALFVSVVVHLLGHRFRFLHRLLKK